MAADEPAFDAAVRQLLAALGAQSGSRPALAADLSTVQRTLARRAFQLGAGEESEDIAAEALLRMVSNADRLDPQGNPAGWLFTVVARLVIDRSRKARPLLFDDATVAELSPVESGTDETDDVIASTDAQALLRRLLLDGRRGSGTMARVLTASLDLAARGETISTRLVAAETGLSHTGVLLAFRRIGELIRAGDRGERSHKA